MRFLSYEHVVPLGADSVQEDLNVKNIDDKSNEQVQDGRAGTSQPHDNELNAPQLTPEEQAEADAVAELLKKDKKELTDDEKDQIREFRRKDRERRRAAKEAADSQPTEPDEPQLTPEEQAEADAVAELLKKDKKELTDDEKDQIREFRRKDRERRRAAKEAASSANNTEHMASHADAKVIPEGASYVERLVRQDADPMANIEAAVAAAKAASKDSSIKSNGPTLEAPEEVLTTLRNDGKRNWMYPVLSGGGLWQRRRLLAYTLITLFFALPIIPINGNPALFLDIVNGQFHILGLTLWRTDLIIMMLFVMSCLLSVVYVTALFGRVWCGWACPQTVYMEFIFRPIERLIEGKASQRRKLDEKGTFKEKSWRKVLKYIIYAIIAILMAHGFVAYFVGWKNLIHWIGHSPTDHWGFFVMMAITSGMVFFDFTYFREQMCTITCPYARIQSVLQDRHSMIVSFDPSRGEPRGRRNRELRSEEEKGLNIGLGDCIDCKACVRTCPTGIDIRDGLQMECIGCTQCIDACHDIMVSIDKPTGLIRYTSENEIDRKLLEKGRNPTFGKKEDVVPPAFIRPRTIFYTIGLVLLLSILVTVLVLRSPIDVSALRISRGVAPYTVVDKNTISNRVQFVLSNRTPDTQHFVISAVEPKGAVVSYPDNKTTVKAGGSIKIDTFVLAPKSVFNFGSVKAKFKVTVKGHEDKIVEYEDFTLLGPD